MENDIINVRPDERFDEEKLATYLADKLDGADASQLKVKQFGGGAANLTYELNYPQATYVLRRPPLGRVAKSAHDMSREYKVLSVLHQVFPYAPKAYHFCDDDTIIGSEFFIMERKYGTVIRREIPNNFSEISNLGSVVSKSLVDTLVEFHDVNYNEIGLGDLGKPEGFVERQIEGWYRRWNNAKLKENNDMDTVYHWLVQNTPEDYPFSIVHNDYKLDNVMFDKNDPSKLNAVFDWDMATLGTPLSDLASLLTYWVEASDPQYLKQVAMMPTEDVGFFTRDQLVHRYSQKSGISVNNINFYHTLGIFRLVVIIAQIYYRYAKGQTQDQRFASFGKLVTLFARAALDRTKNE